MGPRRAKANHAEDDPQGHAVEGRPYQDVIGANEQAIDPHVHDCQARTVLGRKIRLVSGVAQQVHVPLETVAVEPEASQDAQGEKDGAEGPHNRRAALAQGGGNLRHGVAQGLVQHRHSHQTQQYAGQGGRVEVIALVDVGGMGGHGRGQEPDENPHHQHQRHAGDGDAAHLAAAGVTQQQLAGQGAQGGREHRQIVILGEGLLPGQRMEHHAQEEGPDIQEVDAEGGKSHGEEVGGNGCAVDHRAGQARHSRAHPPHQGHIQERTGHAADGKVVLGQLCGGHQDGCEARHHFPPVRGQPGGNHKRGGRSQKEQADGLNGVVFQGFQPPISRGSAWQPRPHGRSARRLSQPPRRRAPG